MILNLAFWPMISSLDGPKQPDLVQNAPFGWPLRLKCNFNPILCSIYGILDSKRPLFAHIMALWGPLGGVQRSGNGSVMPSLLT